MSTLYSYCRFCAEEKAYGDIMDLATQKTRRSIIKKLSLIGVVSVDFSNKTLPEKACTDCYRLINELYKFFLKVKRSQKILSERLSNQLQIRSEFGNDVSSAEVKEENMVNEGDYTSGGRASSHANVWPEASPVHADEIKPGAQDVTLLKEDHHEERAGERGSESLLLEHGRRAPPPSPPSGPPPAASPPGAVSRPALACECDSKSRVLASETSGTPCKVCGRGLSPHHTQKQHARTDGPGRGRSGRGRRGAGRGAAGGGARGLECHVCGNILKTHHSLRAHLATHGERVREHTCERCGRAYYTRAALQAHRYTHEAANKEACRVCHKSFLTLSRLKKHVRTHNLAMPYSCDACRRTYSSKDRLREHVKVHMDVLPHRCRFCPKRFRHRSIVKIHENQHTGARPYSCEACGMDFANWSNCNKHCKRKHGTTIATHALTPHGKVPLDPATGEPRLVRVDRAAREWTEAMLRRRGGTEPTILMEN